VVSLKQTDISEVHIASIIRAMMEAVQTSETSVYFNKTTQRYIPEGYHLHEFPNHMHSSPDTHLYQWDPLQLVHRMNYLRTPNFIHGQQTPSYGTENSLLILCSPVNKLSVVTQRLTHLMNDTQPTNVLHTG
jgi:hypothetical protein